MKLQNNVHFIAIVLNRLTISINDLMGQAIILSSNRFWQNESKAQWGLYYVRPKWISTKGTQSPIGPNWDLQRRMLAWRENWKLKQRHHKTFAFSCWNRIWAVNQWNTKQTNPGIASTVLEEEESSGTSNPTIKIKP